MTSLFRDEALAAQRAQWLGEIVIIQPISFRILTLAAVLMGMVVVAFFIFGSYTKRSTVSGQLVPSGGQVRVYTPQSGIVVEKFVNEAQPVAKGDVLYTLSSERYDGESAPVQEGISRMLKERVSSLHRETEQLPIVQGEERQSQTTKVLNLKKEIISIQQQLVGQEKLIALSKDINDRYQKMQGTGVISYEVAQKREADLLSQQQQKESLARDLLIRQQALSESEHTLASLSVRQENETAELSRRLSQAEQDLVESEAKRVVKIVAPESGVATAVTAEVGQTLDGSRPLLSIVPQNGELEAELYAPSKSVGFVRTGDRVLLRYNAYPYQKFGQFGGEVVSVSRTAVSATELSGLSPSEANSSEQLFRIRVDLDRQDITAYGKQHALQSGMLLSGDILQETRHLYEWVLEPLYSLTGKL